MSINTVTRIDDHVKIRNALISVSDKSGLETFIPELIAASPEIRIFSTGGTYKTIASLMPADTKAALVPVSEYTGQPETQGGLVKTLDFKIYLGLLTETYNQAHQEDLDRTGAAPIDMVVVNLYPFQQTVAQEGVTAEAARGNIDIGGPCMIRAAAKNFIRVTPVVDPADYAEIMKELRANQGATTLATRAALAKKAFAHTADYDRAITDYLQARSLDEIAAAYPEIR
jgi:phosphoribosylaminoimidazolecarboxamide formyltransferase/IMP cyclohydrolase